MFPEGCTCGFLPSGGVDIDPNCPHHGWNSTKEDSLDEFHYHEMTDRLHVINCMLDDFILSHPVAEQDEVIAALVSDAQDLLSVAYQRVGKIEFKRFPPDEREV